MKMGCLIWRLLRMKDFSELTYKELFNMAMECLLSIVNTECCYYGMYDEIDTLEHIYNYTDRFNNDDGNDNVAESDMNNFIMNRFMRRE